MHRLLLARPRAGMTEQEFGDRWVHQYAATVAARPEVRRFVVGTKVTFAPEPADPPWAAAAEVWLDEPTGAGEDWPAGWPVLALDTDEHEWAGGEPPSAGRTWVKASWLAKRRAAVPLTVARAYALTVHQPFLTGLPGIRRVVQSHTRGTGDAGGEAPVDFVFGVWFDSLDALGEAIESSRHQALLTDRNRFCEPRSNHQLVTREHWVIGPRPR